MSEESIGPDSKEENKSETNESKAIPESITSVSNLSPQNQPDASCGCDEKDDAGMRASHEKLFIYAIGRIEPRFPSVGVEMEYRQALGRIESKGSNDHESMQRALSAAKNRYLLKEMCWVLEVEGIETYLLAPRESSDLDLLVQAMRVEPRVTDLDVVIGTKGPIASPTMCNGLMVPIVFFDQIYSFDRDGLINAIPKPPKADTKKFRATAEGLFNRISQLADNVGSLDEHRALNYLSVRYDAIYSNIVEMNEDEFSLMSVDVRPSRLSGTRKIVDIILKYSNRKTDVAQSYFVRVDVTEKFPFLVTKLSPYYER